MLPHAPQRGAKSRAASRRSGRGFREISRPPSGDHGVSKSTEVAKRLADELASCGIKLVVSLPDNWIAELIERIAHDDRFVHVAVNREESAVGLCSGAYMGGTGSAALMGASGFM